MIETKINFASLEILVDFFIENDNIFIPPLNTQVKSIEEYVKKIKYNAVVFEAWDNGKPVGLIAAYFNNYETKIGFITSVIVSVMYQKQGIGKMLMKKAIDFAKENGFVKIQLEVYKENRNAINMYVKFKFRKNDSIKMQSFLMELDLNDI